MNETKRAIKSGFSSADENYGKWLEVARMTTQSPTRAKVKSAGDACAEKTSPNSTNHACPDCQSLDPADHERLLNCASIIRLRAVGAVSWITPWCAAGLPSDVMAQARLGGLPARTAKQS